MDLESGYGAIAITSALAKKMPRRIDKIFSKVIQHNLYTFTSSNCVYPEFVLSVLYCIYTCVIHVISML